MNYITISKSELHYIIGTCNFFSDSSYSNTTVLPYRWSLNEEFLRNLTFSYYIKSYYINEKEHNFDVLVCEITKEGYLFAKAMYYTDVNIDMFREYLKNDITKKLFHKKVMLKQEVPRKFCIFVKNFKLKRKIEKIKTYAKVS